MAIRKGWSIDPIEINTPELNDLLNKIEWNNFPASYNNLDRVPKLPGIYIFSAIKKIDSFGKEKSLETPIYIGISTHSIYSRYKDHRTKPWFDKCYKSFHNNFSYSFVTTENEDLDRIALEKLETILINAFGPVVNDKRSYTGDGIRAQ